MQGTQVKLTLSYFLLLKLSHFLYLNGPQIDSGLSLSGPTTWTRCRKLHTWKRRRQFLSSAGCRCRRSSILRRWGSSDSGADEDLPSIRTLLSWRSVTTWPRRSFLTWTTTGCPLEEQVTFIFWNLVFKLKNTFIVS